MRIVIPGDPISKKRHRLTTIGGFARQYDPQEKQKKSFARELIKAAKQWQPAKKHLKVDLIFKMDAKIGSSKAESNLKSWGCSYPLKKDLDNMEKFVLDCGNEILWTDDRYILQLSSRKVFSLEPCTIIDIEPIEEMKMSEEQERVFKTFSPNELECMISEFEKMRFNSPDINDQDHEKFQEKITNLSKMLIEFANKWADKLKKIKGKS